jgi:hypothetical protein
LSPKHPPKCSPPLSALRSPFRIFPSLSAPTQVRCRLHERKPRPSRKPRPKPRPSRRNSLHCKPTATLTPRRAQAQAQAQDLCRASRTVRTVQVDLRPVYSRSSALCVSSGSPGMCVARFT